MKIILILFFGMLAAGCETTVTLTDPLGNSIEMSETAYLAKVNAEAISSMGVPADPCKPNLGVSYKDMSASGQEAIGRALEMCNIRMMVATAMGQPSSAQGQIAAANTKAIVAIEAGQASKVRSGFNFGAIGLGAYFTADIFSSAFAAAGASYTIGDITASNSSYDTGGAGGEGSGGNGSDGGDRNMAVNIGGNQAFQPGDSNTQATAEKATSVDNPIVDGSNNSIVNDADEVNPNLF